MNDIVVKAVIGFKNGIEKEVVQKFETLEDAVEEVKDAYEHFKEIFLENHRGWYAWGNYIFKSEEVISIGFEDLTEPDIFKKDPDKLQKEIDDLNLLLKGVF